MLSSLAYRSKIRNYFSHLVETDSLIIREHRQKPYCLLRAAMRFLFLKTLLLCTPKRWLPLHQHAKNTRSKLKKDKSAKNHFSLICHPSQVSAIPTLPAMTHILPNSFIGSFSWSPYTCSPRPRKAMLSHIFSLSQSIIKSRQTAQDPCVTQKF